MKVTINFGDAGGSRIDIHASNFGFGPIQSSHVKGKVRTLRQRIEGMFQQGPQPAPPAQQGNAQPQAAAPTRRQQPNAQSSSQPGAVARP